MGDRAENIADNSNMNGIVLNNDMCKRTAVGRTPAQPETERQKEEPGGPQIAVYVIIGFGKIPVDPCQALKIEGHRSAHHQVARPAYKAEQRNYEEAAIDTAPFQRVPVLAVVPKQENYCHR